MEGKNGGAVINANAFELGDSTISLRELWGAEYQESDAVLLDPKLLDKVKRIAKRERCIVSLVGKVTGNQQIILKEHQNNNIETNKFKQFPVDLNLEEIAERDAKVTFFALFNLNFV